MEARRFGPALVAVFTLALMPVTAIGASARSQNFIVSAPNRALATEICEAAENFRRELAIEWLGAELAPWSQPCPIQAQVDPQLGAGGATQFSFSRQGMPFGWSMSIQGSKERVIDSVLPHEITHTIFATHFGRPLPRWADEGACTTVEHTSEKVKQERFLIDFLMTERGIPFNKMFAMKEYPPDMLPLYAQGYSLARYLIMQGGKRKYVQYVGEGMQTDNWPAATRKYYGHKDLSDLQVTWLDWVRAGSPRLQPVEGMESRGNTMIANNAAVHANIAPVQPSNAPPSVVASPVTPSPKVIPAHQAAVHPATPPRPAFQLSNQAENSGASSVARPYSAGGWYARQANAVGQGDGTEAVSHDSHTSQHAIVPLSPPEPVYPAARGNDSGNGSSNAPPPHRRVMLEWSRPTDQPWTPGSITGPDRANELLTRRDLPAASGGRALR